MQRAGWQAWLAALGLLGLGAVGGIAFDRFHVRGHGPASVHDEVRRDAVGYMERVLSLRPEQRDRIAHIYAGRQRQLDGIWEDTHTRLLATLDSVVNEISAELDSAQLPRFRALVEELHSTPGFRDATRGLHPR
jgi:hypothetical protein